MEKGVALHDDPRAERIAEPALTALPRGTNQSGMRAHNERLVLTLVRSHGAHPGGPG